MGEKREDDGDNSEGGEAVLEHACRSFTTIVQEVMDGRPSFKGLDNVLTILEVGYTISSGIIERVALPLHEILHTRAMVLLFQDGLLFILRKPCNS